MELSLNKSGEVDIRKMGDPVLKRKCDEVTDFGDKTKKLAKQLQDDLATQDGIGLAANQIGISLRAFSYDLTDRDLETQNIKGVIFNPVIEEFSDNLTPYAEGCLSIPEFFWEIYRPNEIVVSGLDEEGNEVRFELSNLASKLFQHEIDHLDGLLVFDRIEDSDERSAAFAEAVKVLSEGVSNRDKYDSDSQVLD